MFCERTAREAEGMICGVGPAAICRGCAREAAALMVRRGFPLTYRVSTSVDGDGAVLVVRTTQAGSSRPEAADVWAAIAPHLERGLGVARVEWVRIVEPVESAAVKVTLERRGES
jgi:hypothetical protein